MIYSTVLLVGTHKPGFKLVLHKETVVHPPLLFRKLSNPDLSPAAGKTKLQRQLSQDDGRARRSSMASGLTGKQLLPLSSSMHSGVSQLAWQQQTGEPNNLVRMRSQSLGQSAPSLTAGLVSVFSHWCIF
ncbi:microtubule-associated serine/threonine-protein kinase 2 isoform X1 [Astyanax mexicanus]|uniref:Microtubule-associated serine/threonine-protein kinase 2 isoform X1 n=1 Tax=Astyanax mexicanus TaxID=7994 RepID=A0A8T2M6H0_ASTMX|nr:microtubule-associated serine/threonine-protein kinase 2 isoform X1 [Astyanax mexicanus]